VPGGNDSLRPCCTSRGSPCLPFQKLLLQWTFTTLRLYQARFFDLKSHFCGPYIFLYSECGHHSQPQGANSQRNVFHGKCLFINLKNMNLMKLDNISSKKLYAGEFNIILMGVMARLKKFNLYILKSFVSENLLS